MGGPRKARARRDVRLLQPQRRRNPREPRSPARGLANEAGGGAGAGIGGLSGNRVHVERVRSGGGF